MTNDMDAIPEEIDGNKEHTDSVNASAGHNDNGVNGHDISKRKEKRRSQRPKSKRGSGKPTGMEEYYADTPPTPDQVAEQRKVYKSSLPFLERLTAAIQRFERSRRLVPARRDAFYKWLQYGGIETGPNMFLGDIDKENMDKDEIAAAFSVVRITNELRIELENEEKYIVDFEICMRGFLSYRARCIWSFEIKEQVDMVTTTLERFMDYLLQHNVCPEYATDILNARNLCRAARHELWNCSQAQRRLPGDFNIACSTLFGGQYEHNDNGETWWGAIEKNESVFVGLTPETATQIVGFGIAGAASEDVYQRYHSITQIHSEQHLQVVKIIKDQGFEITRIDSPSEEYKSLYITRSENFQPVGLVHGKAWKIPETAPEDLTDEEKKTLSMEAKTSEPDEYVFLLEEAVLQHLSVGQKIEANIHQLNCGVWFFDEVIRVLPKFETYLLNEMMVEFKRPKPLKGALDYVADKEFEIEPGQTPQQFDGNLQQQEEQDEADCDEAY